MKQLLVLSGKGGTGKTTLASAFIKLGHVNVYGDCDVDAPNLHLISSQNSVPKVTDYYGLPKAEIDTSKCIHCDICKVSCHFEAISSENGYHVDPYKCEGCGVCERICPAQAVLLKPVIAGRMKLYTNENMFFSTAQLNMGSGTSGKLVSEVKKPLKSSRLGVDYAVIDGSPGIGCPVIASLSGVDLALVVTEPSISGMSDMKRILKTANQLNVKTAVCINKYDIHLELSKEIETYCNETGVVFLGCIPYDSEAVKVINAGLTLVDVESVSGKAIENIFEKTKCLLLEAENVF